MYKNKVTIDGKERNNIAGLEITELRKKRRWSQNDLAIQLQTLGLDLHKNAISDIEAGKRFITDIELLKIAEVFDIKIDDLLEQNKANYGDVISHVKSKDQIKDISSPFEKIAEEQ